MTRQKLLYCFITSILYKEWTSNDNKINQDIAINNASEGVTQYRISCLSWPSTLAYNYLSILLLVSSSTTSKVFIIGFNLPQVLKCSIIKCVKYFIWIKL